MQTNGRIYSKRKGHHFTFSVREKNTYKRQEDILIATSPRNTKEDFIKLTKSYIVRQNITHKPFEKSVSHNMADCCSRSVVTLVTILLFIGIGGMVCGAIGTSWFKQSSLDTHVGLLKSCQQSLDLCLDREFIFQFKKEHEAFFVGVENRCKCFNKDL